MRDAWIAAKRAIPAADRSRAEQIIVDLADEVDKLRAECERHRRANLVRSVLDGWDEGIDGGLTDYINAEGWDAVPWKIAQQHIDRAAHSDQTGGES